MIFRRRPALTVSLWAPSISVRPIQGPTSWRKQKCLRFRRIVGQMRAGATLPHVLQDVWICGPLSPGLAWWGWMKPMTSLRLALEAETRPFHVLLVSPASLLCRKSAIAHGARRGRRGRLRMIASALVEARYFHLPALPCRLLICCRLSRKRWNVRQESKSASACAQESASAS